MFISSYRKLMVTKQHKQHIVLMVYMDVFVDAPDHVASSYKHCWSGCFYTLFIFFLKPCWRVNSIFPTKKKEIECLYIMQQDVITIIFIIIIQRPFRYESRILRLINSFIIWQWILRMILIFIRITQRLKSINENSKCLQSWCW